MRAVPRHLFVPEARRRQAYEDHALPIGLRQTISQPYIVALMTALLEPEPNDKMLEIGTGSGYQAAVLSKLVDHVYTIEIVAPLADRAKKTLQEQGFDNVTVIKGDGYRGIPGEAPFDGIIVTAAPGHVPQPLIDQLDVGAHLVIPVGTSYQELKTFTRTPDGIETRTQLPVRFVPMTGEAQKKKK
jgi:protein-L-isoaspartate(D-aspartate) O-methyltransferase